MQRCKLRIIFNKCRRFNLTARHKFFHVNFQSTAISTSAIDSYSKYSIYFRKENIRVDKFGTMKY